MTADRRAIVTDPNRRARVGLSAARPFPVDTVECDAVSDDPTRDNNQPCRGALQIVETVTEVRFLARGADVDHGAPVVAYDSRIVSGAGDDYVECRTCHTVYALPPEATLDYV